MNSNVLSSGVLLQLVVTERQYLDVERLFFRRFCIFEFRALILIFLSLSNLVMSGAKNILCASVLPLVERGSSVGRMPDSQSREPGFESPLLPFRSLGIFFHFTTPQSSQLYK